MARFLWCAVASLFIGCQGLEFTLSPTTQDAADTRYTCGVLLCVESYTTASNASLTQTGGDTGDSAGPRQQTTTISSLNVFKVERDTSNQDKKRRLIASVTAQQPRLTRVSNGINMDGHLEAGWATLRLEFAKQNDCQADYICESLAVSAQGNKLLSSSNILQQSRQSSYQGSDVSWTPQATVRVLALVQQLDTKLGYLGSSVGKLEGDLDSLKADLNTKTDRLEDKVLTIGRDVSTQSDRLEDKLVRLEDKLVRLEDKIESMQKDFNTRIDRFENRVEDSVRSLESGSNNDLNTKLDSYFSGLGERIGAELKTDLSALSNKVSTVQTNLVQLGTRMDTGVGDALKQLSGELRERETKEEQFLKNLTLHAHNVSMCEHTEALSVASISESFASLEDTVQNKLEDLSSDINVSAIETRAFVTRAALQSNLTFSKELRSALTDALAPKDCFRGMVSILASKPYTVIHPGQESTLGFPVLCDTFTDGGGWIVIQRRVTGDVSFYRGWEDYKTGFGSMDGDFWLGNERIHAITSGGTYELRIDLRYKGNSAFAHYDTFSLGNEASNYVLQVGHYDGTAGDSLAAGNGHNGMPFSTHDKDNDRNGGNCAVIYLGAWWYNSCHASNLNGMWNEGSNKGPRWNSLSGAEAVSYTEMKIRRVITTFK